MGGASRFSLGSDMLLGGRKPRHVRYWKHEQNSDRSAALDPHHTHFILVDDKEGRGWGDETKMRDEVERARITELLTQLAPLCARQSLIVLRTPLDPDRVDHSVPGLHGPEAHRYGPAMWVLLYEPADTIDDGTGADAPESE